MAEDSTARLPSPAKSGTGSLSRRSLLGTIAVAGLVSPSVGATPPAPASPMLDRSAFSFDGIFLNAAYVHPMPRQVAATLKDYSSNRQSSVSRSWTSDNFRVAAIEQFAGLVNVSQQDLAIVPSTMAGENMIADAIGLGAKAGVITDSLHYFGSLALYQQRAAGGMPLKVVHPRANRIELDDIERTIDGETRMIAVSLVSGLNGFMHDLSALCRLAHARGVLVYADLIQAAGAVPIDLSASGVDFACCGSYKWLMGDFGAAFLYARRDRLPLLSRRATGWRQIEDHQTHWLPFDAPGGEDEFTFVSGPAGLFEVGTPSHATLASLAKSIEALRAVGVEALMQRRKPLLELLQQELSGLGLTDLSPQHNNSGIATFAFENAAQRIAPELARAGVTAQTSPHRIRFSPSSYSSTDDIESAIAAVRRAVRI